jgi:signal peptidase II
MSSGSDRDEDMREGEGAEDAAREADEREADGEERAEAKAESKGSGERVPVKAKEPTPHVTVGQWAFLAVVALVTAGLDLWTKGWAVRRLSAPIDHPPPVCVAPPGMAHYLYQRRGTDPVVLINNFLDLSYAENCGGAWGLLHSAKEGLRRPFFLLVTLGATVFIVYLYRGLEQTQRSMRVALPLVLGGAIGNLVDRIRLGYVVDFIHAHWRDKYHWPTFNVADIAITVGIGLMLLEYVIGPKKPPVKRPVKAHARAAG